MSTADEEAGDAHFMARAIALSLTHLGQTGSNPSVGCIIVSKDGAVVGDGVTAIGGRPHAEVVALAIAGDHARGATAYVTLEPCAHYGKTPPCANALVAADIGRVVVSLIDPDERVAGKGLEILRDAGIDVTTGVLQAEAEQALQAYLMRKRAGRPFVTLKLAVSADGKIGVEGQGQVRITGTESRAHVQQMRAESDAILVGIGTALADDPELTCRLPGLEHRSPVRIVLDRRLELPLTSKLAMSARAVPVIVVGDGDVESAAALEALGVEVLTCDPRDLSTLLQALGTRGLSSLMVEGGSKIAKSFLDAGLVDRILLFTGPDALGIEGIPSPLDRHGVPDGFVHRQTLPFGKDRLDDYIFEREV